MNDLFRQIAERKDFGPGRTATRGERLVYADPAGGVVHAAETDSSVTWFVVSTEQVDRDGDTVSCAPEAWELENFAINPVWLFDHGEGDSRPIGLCRSPETGELLIRFEEVGGQRRVLAGVYWDSGEWGQEVKGLVDRGLLRTASIGFLPKAGRPIPKRGGLPGGKRKDAWAIERLELLELTITPTPSNTGAVRLAIERGELSPVVLKSFKALGTLGDARGGVLVGDKAIDEHAEFKSKLEDCVGRKVKILMDEGKDQKQALAIAYSMCGEEHKAALDVETTPEGPVDGPVEKMKAKSATGSCGGCNGKAKAVTMPDMSDATQVDDGQAGTETPDEATVGPVEPHGVTATRNILEHVYALLEYIDGQVIPGMEPDSPMKAHFEEDVRAVCHEVAAALHEKASEHYPDHDIGEAPPEIEDDEPIPDDGDEGDEEEVEDADGDGESDDGPETAMEEAEHEPGEAKSESGEESESGMSDEEEEEQADKYARSAAYRRKHYRRKAHRIKAAHKAVCMKAVGCMSKAADHLDESSEGDGVEEEKSYMHKGHAAMLRKAAADVSREVIGSEEGGDQPDMPKEGDSGGDMPEEPEEKSVDWSEVMGLTRRLSERLDRVTGKK